MHSRDCMLLPVTLDLVADNTEDHKNSIILLTHHSGQHL